MLIVDPVTKMMVIIAALLLLGRAGEFIFTRTGVPDMIWLVLAGVVAGPVLDLVPLDYLTPVLPFFGAVALIVILGGGGLQLKLKEVARAAPRGAVLAIVGFILAVTGTCVFGEIMSFSGVFPRIGLPQWIMIGSIIGGTSALVVMPTMAGGGVSASTARLLEIESIITDALCVTVSMVVIGLLAGGAAVTHPALYLLREVLIGSLVGVIGAMAMLPMLSRLTGKPEHYTVLLSGFLVLYAAVQVAGGNGALGVLTCALVLGNVRALFGRWRSQDSLPLSGDGTPMMVHGQLIVPGQVLLFFIIGSCFPTSPKPFSPGPGLRWFLALFRIPAVMLSLWRSNFRTDEKRLIATCLPRGLAAGVMSTVPLQAHIQYMEDLTPGIFSTILFTIVIFAGAFAVVKRMRPAAAPQAPADRRTGRPASPEGGGEKGSDLSPQPGVCAPPGPWPWRP
jgi:cell volume regulation protein A